MDKERFLIVITGIERTTWDTQDYMDIDYYDCLEDAFDYADFLIEVTDKTVEDFTPEVAKDLGLNYHNEVKFANQRYNRDCML